MQNDAMKIPVLIAKGIDAFAYSVIHAGLLLLLAWAIILLFAQVVSLHWVWITLIMIFPWGIVSAGRGLAVTFILMPYRCLSKETVLVLILPAICIASTMVLFLIGFWQGFDSMGWKEVICGLFITYECAMLVWQSLVGMFVVCRANPEN
jgi:hypothetical protein